MCDKSHIINVIKYSPGANQIIITIGDDRDNINLSVRDFGIGLHKESLPKYFTGFSGRLETSGECFQAWV